MRPAQQRAGGGEQFRRVRLSAAAGLDPKNVSTCAGIDPTCPTAWPALKPPAKAGASVNAALLAMTNDRKEVTYNGHPLYHYSGDNKASDINGQGAFQVWYVVSPKGTAIKKQ